MKYIQVGIHFAAVSDEDFDRLSKFPWRPQYVESEIIIYALTHIGGKDVPMQNLVNPPLMHLINDHKDGDGLNNTRDNLRLANRSQNAANRRKALGCSSDYKGVYKRGSKFLAMITEKGKLRHLGTFREELKAAQAYNDAALKIYGEFARLNDLEEV